MRQQLSERSFTSTAQARGWLGEQEAAQSLWLVKSDIFLNKLQKWNFQVQGTEYDSRCAGVLSRINNRLKAGLPRISYEVLQSLNPGLDCSKLTEGQILLMANPR